MHSGPTPGKTFALEGDVLTIGREASNQIAINDAEISRKHSQLVAQGGKYVLTDLGSTNGTFVNGQRLTGQHVLQPGEVISLGEQISLLFEAIVIVDPNATMLSNKPIPAPIPRSAPVQQPYAQPQPPAYAGQAPAGPSSDMMAEAPAPPKRNTTLIIIAIIVVLFLLCICVVGISLAFAPCSFWQPIIGGVCPK
jgi:pSer/pThr/pTyr-binding forkhead associated (FHA) protein